MEIFLDKTTVRQLRLSVQDAIEDVENTSLREDVLEAFTDEQIEEIERRLITNDFLEFVTEVVGEWSGEDVDEFFELLESHFGEIGLELKYTRVLDQPGEDEEEEEDIDFEDEDQDD